MREVRSCTHTLKKTDILPNGAEASEDTDEKHHAADDDEEDGRIDRQVVKRTEPSAL